MSDESTSLANEKFDSIANANHFYKSKEKELVNSIMNYVKDKLYEDVDMKNHYIDDQIKIIKQKLR